MVDPAARVPAWARTVDAGRRTRDRHSGGATGRSSGWRSCAAGRIQAGAWVVESAIHSSGRAGRRRARGVLPLLGALCALLAPGAVASPGQESLIEDERLLLEAGPVARAQALDDVAALGADGIRVVVRWRDIAPATRPAGFKPADPAAYPAARWEPLDDLLRGATAR